MSRAGTVYVVDDDRSVLASVTALLEASGFMVQAFESTTEFIGVETSDESCIIVDLRMPEMSGLDLLRRLAKSENPLPVIFITACGDVRPAVEAMKLGAVDFLQKPYEEAALLETVTRALERSRRSHQAAEIRSRATARLESLTVRERVVLDRVLTGMTSKDIAEELGISRRTVEVHRANVLRKTGAQGLSELLQLATEAGLPTSTPNT